MLQEAPGTRGPRVDSRGPPSEGLRIMKDAGSDAAAPEACAPEAVADAGGRRAEAWGEVRRGLGEARVEFAQLPLETLETSVSSEISHGLASNLEICLCPARAGGRRRKARGSLGGST